MRKYDFFQEFRFTVKMLRRQLHEDRWSLFFMFALGIATNIIFAVLGINPLKLLGGE